MDITRRSFVKGALLGGAAVGAISLTQSRRLDFPFSQKADTSGLTPASALLSSQTLALGKVFPALTDPEASGGPIIVNTLSASRVAGDYSRFGDPGNSFFLKEGSGRATLPWTPIFVRENNLLQLPSSVTRQIDCAEVLVVNESSSRFPLFGNKARKYEFLLPNLKWSGSQRLATIGAVSSNHALQFALANRVSDLAGDGTPLNCDLDLVLFEVPGAKTDIERLTTLRGLVQRITLAKNELELAGDAAPEYARGWLHPDTDAVVPPGGSNEVSALGHMNAIAELAQLLDSAQAWDTPPDIIFVPMGSGSTVLGLLLGVHLLKWNTKIVGVADQDKPYLTRLLINHQPLVPFVEGNVSKLAFSTVEWLQKIRFPGISPDTLRVIKNEIFIPDATIWRPGYGLVEGPDLAWAEQLGDAGLRLDPVFTMKAWRSLLSMSRAGALKNKKVLFWNTYNSFDYAPSAVSSLG